MKSISISPRPIIPLLLPELEHRYKISRLNHRLPLLHLDGAGRSLLLMASLNNHNHHFRHADSTASPPSSAVAKISHLKAVVLGDAPASEEDDVVLPSHDFSRQALVPSQQKVSSHCSLNWILLNTELLYDHGFYGLALIWVN